MQDFEPYSLALRFMEDIEAVHSSCKLRPILSHLPVQLNVDKTQEAQIQKTEDWNIMVPSPLPILSVAG